MPPLLWRTGDAGVELLQGHQAVLNLSGELSKDVGLNEGMVFAILGNFPLDVCRVNPMAIGFETIHLTDMMVRVVLGEFGFDVIKLAHWFHRCAGDEEVVRRATIFHVREDARLHEASLVNDGYEWPRLGLVEALGEAAVGREPDVTVNAADLD